MIPFEVHDGGKMDWKSGKSEPIVPGGQPPHDPDMEPRVAVLEQIAKSTEATLNRIEARLGTIETKFDGKFDKVAERHDRDFRITFGAIIAVALGLAGLMAKGFHWY